MKILAATIPFKYGNGNFGAVKVKKHKDTYDILVFRNNRLQVGEIEGALTGTQALERAFAIAESYEKTCSKH